MTESVIYLSNGFGSLCVDQPVAGERELKAWLDETQERVLSNREGPRGGGREVFERFFEDQVFMKTGD
jgi:hypothetical protein